MLSICHLDGETLGIQNCILSMLIHLFILVLFSFIHSDSVDLFKLVFFIFHIVFLIFSVSVKQSIYFK